MTGREGCNPSQYLRDFFTQFSPVSRVFSAKDTDNNKSRDFALITFNNKEDAQKARECVGEFGHDHLILKFDWIKFVSFEISFFDFDFSFLVNQKLNKITIIRFV